MDNSDRYVQAKFNYGLKTQESIFNDTEEIARLLLNREYGIAYEFLEVFINKISAEMKETNYKKIKDKMKDLRKIYKEYMKYKSSVENTKSRYARIAIKNNTDPNIFHQLREGLLEVDYLIRQFLKSKGISSPKESDEMHSIVEGK